MILIKSLWRQGHFYSLLQTEHLEQFHSLTKYLLLNLDTSYVTFQIQPHLPPRFSPWLYLSLLTAISAYEIHIVHVAPLLKINQSSTFVPLSDYDKILKYSHISSKLRPMEHKHKRKPDIIFFSFFHLRDCYRAWFSLQQVQNQPGWLI